jgi:hypothetical protein
MKNKSEEIRIRYLYRDLVLRGRIKLPLEAARKIVGPDCAYHLYSVMDRKEINKPPLPPVRKKTSRP